MSDAQKSIAKDKLTHRKLRTNMQLCAGSDPTVFAQEIDEINKWLLTVEDKSSPHTKDSKMRIYILWCELIDCFYPDLGADNLEAHWETDIVRKHAAQFLPVYVRVVYYRFPFVYSQASIR